MVIKISPGESKTISDPDKVEFHHDFNDDFPAGVEISKAKAHGKFAECKSTMFHVGPELLATAASGIIIEIDGSPNQRLNIEIRDTEYDYHIEARGTATASLDLGTFLKPHGSIDKTLEPQYRETQVELSGSFWSGKTDNQTYTETDLGLSASEMNNGDRYDIGVYAETNANGVFVHPLVPSAFADADVFNEEDIVDTHWIHFTEIALTWG